MVGWPGREAEPGPYILGLPSRPAPPYLPGRSFKILYTPPTHTLGGVPQRDPLFGRAGPEPGREEAHQAHPRNLKVHGPSSLPGLGTLAL